MPQKKMPMLDARVDAKGWKWSEEHGLWSGPDDSFGYISQLLMTNKTEGEDT
jgi:hypothetical protein